MKSTNDNFSPTLQASLRLAYSVQYAPNPRAAWLSELTHPALKHEELP